VAASFKYRCVSKYRSRGAAEIAEKEERRASRANKPGLKLT
jgi:hypothetical protein